MSEGHRLAMPEGGQLLGWLLLGEALGQCGGLCLRPGEHWSEQVSRLGEGLAGWTLGS